MKYFAVIDTNVLVSAMLKRILRRIRLSARLLPEV